MVKEESNHDQEGIRETAERPRQIGGADMFRKYGKFGKWMDGFRAGIKAAKWIMHPEYATPIRKSVQTVREEG